MIVVTLLVCISPLFKLSSCLTVNDHGDRQKCKIKQVTEGSNIVNQTEIELLYYFETNKIFPECHDYEVYYRMEGNTMVKYCIINESLTRDLTEIPATPPVPNAELVLLGDCGYPHNVLEALFMERQYKYWSFKKYKDLVRAAGITIADFEGKTPVTIFAPLDEAIDKLDNATVEALMNDPPALKALLLKHVVVKRIIKHEWSDQGDFILKTQKSKILNPFRHRGTGDHRK